MVSKLSWASYADLRLHWSLDLTARVDFGSQSERELNPGSRRIAQAPTEMANGFGYWH
jgi:hypothetical protein